MLKCQFLVFMTSALSLRPRDFEAQVYFQAPLLLRDGETFPAPQTCARLAASFACHLLSLQLRLMCCTALLTMRAGNSRSLPVTKPSQEPVAGS